jgi:hypothetical protein
MPGKGSREKWAAAMRRGDHLRTGRVHINEDPVIPAAGENFDAHLNLEAASPT